MSDNMLLEWDELDFPMRVAIAEESLTSFLSFVQLWFELIQGDRLLVNWHHQYMAATIDELIAGKLNPRNVIINIPPGGTKTEFFSIHLPAYLNTLVQEGALQRFRNLNISYADSLVKRNSRRTRDIIASREYQALWPCKFGVNQAEEWEVFNALGRSIAQTISKSAGGQITGGRGGYIGPAYSGHIMLDDFNKPVDMFSETKRQAANSMLTNTIRSRRNDKSKDHPTPIISIQQRLHTDDATGFMLSGGMGMRFHHISIPALINREYLDSLPKRWRDACWNCIKDSESRIVGGVEYWSYWPETEHIDDLMALWEKDPYTFWSQYMQKPQKLTGGIFQTDWFQTYTTLPRLKYRAIFVDTNSGKVNDYNDYTVFTLVGVGVDDNLYIIEVDRGKWDPEELLTKAIELFEKWSPYDPRNPAPIRYMGIEDKQAGQGLITTLKKRRGAIAVEEIPRGAGENKLVRALNSVPQIKSGRVFVPATHDADGKPIHITHYADGRQAGSTTWMIAAMAEFEGFSADDSHDHDDIVDTWMDAISRCLIDDDGAADFSGW